MEVDPNDREKIYALAINIGIIVILYITIAYLI
jgi:hypothetical protein